MKSISAQGYLINDYSLIRCGDSENGRWHVLNVKNVHRKRSAARS